MAERRCKRVGIFVGDGLARTVGAGHHQNFRRAKCEQKMVQRSVRKHHAEFAAAGRDARKMRFRGGQHDWARSGREQRFGVG